MGNIMCTIGCIVSGILGKSKKRVVHFIFGIKINNFCTSTYRGPLETRVPRDFKKTDFWCGHRSDLWTPYTLDMLGKVLHQVKINNFVENFFHEFVLWVSEIPPHMKTFTKVSYIFTSTSIPRVAREVV